MANLTGEYDVAVEVPVHVVNRILAAIHENEDTNFPVLLHSRRLFVNDTPRGSDDPVPPSERTGVQAVVEIQLSTPTVSLLQGLLVGHNISVSLTTGVARPFGSARSYNISVSSRVRAWVHGSPQPSLPEFLHGDLIVQGKLVLTRLEPTFDPGLLGRVRPVFGTFIGLDRTTGLAVAFLPAAGTSLPEEERARIQRIVHNVLRSDFRPITFQVNMPEGVHQLDFRLNPDRPSVTLMLLLTPRALGPGAVASFSSGLAPAGSDFAIGVGRDYLLPLLKSLVLQGLPGESSFSGFAYSGKVRPNWAAAGFDLEPGRLVLTVAGSGAITYDLGIGSTTDEFTFTIRQAFALSVVEGALEPRRDGDPLVDVDGIFVPWVEGIVEQKARDRVRDEIDRALAQFRDQIRGALEVQRQLEQVLSGIHPSPAGVGVAGVELRPEGVLVLGRIALAPSRPVVVRHVKRLGMIDALDSWIPGGTIDRFVWSHDRPESMPLIIGGRSLGGGQRVEEHRFVTEDSESPVVFALRCLDVYGHRITSSGSKVPVTGHACGFYVPVLIWPSVRWPAKSGRTMPVVPLRGVRPDGTVGIVGHFGPWASGLAPADGKTTTVVHFAANGWADTARTLARALDRVRDAAVVAVVLLPSGSLPKAPRVTIDTEAGFVVGEDVGGHWAEALRVSKVPATVVVDHRGRIVFSEEGPVSEPTLGRVLAEHVQPGGQLSWQPLRLAVVAGDRTPEFPFCIDGGAELSMRRLRGRRVVLAFWASWCEPSLEQLRELRRALEVSRGQGPMVLAIGDGEPADRAAAVAQEQGLTFPLIPDPVRAISRRFVVGVWPSMVWIGHDMRVEAVHLGLTGLDGAAPKGCHPSSQM